MLQEKGDEKSSETEFRSVHDNFNEINFREVFDTDEQGNVIDAANRQSDQGLSETQQQQLVDAVNAKRRTAGASDMQKVVSMLLRCVT